MASFNRRRFIERMGLSGAASFFVAPLLQRLIGEAHGAVPNQRRIVFVANGHGIGENIRRPKTLRSPSDFDLSEALAPWEPYKNRLRIFDGLYNTNNGDLHGAGHSFFTCVPGPGTSIDQVIAARIPAAPRGERSVHLGINREPVIVEGQLTGGAGLFSRGGAAIAPHVNPIESVKVLFGQAPAAATPAPTTGVDTRLNLLSFVASDIRKASRRLAGPEREKLELYLASVEQMEMRAKVIKTMPLASAGKCTVPAVSHIKAAKGTFPYPWDTAAGALNPSATLRDAYVDIALGVLGCGISNVVTLEMFMGGNGIYLLDLFEGEPAELVRPMRAMLSNMHDVYHGKIKNEAFAATLPQAERDAIIGRVQRRFQHLGIQAVRRLLDGLASMPEGNGTMLDNTVVVWGSDCGGAHHGGQSDLPVFVLGNVGGQLPAGPRYFKFAKGTRPQTELWLALARLMDAREPSGAPLPTFGQGGKDPCGGPLPLS